MVWYGVVWCGVKEGQEGGGEGLSSSRRVLGMAGTGRVGIDHAVYRLGVWLCWGGAFVRVGAAEWERRGSLLARCAGSGRGAVVGYYGREEGEGFVTVELKVWEEGGRRVWLIRYWDSTAMLEDV